MMTLLVGPIARLIVFAALALTLALGVGAATGEPAGAATAKQCKQLRWNMTMWNDSYWDAVEAGDSEGAAEARQGYFLNERTYRAAGC